MEKGGKLAFDLSRLSRFGRVKSLGTSLALDP